MKGLGVGVVIILITMTSYVWIMCDGCFEDERVALLDLQSSVGFNCPIIRDDDCCGWVGVECNSTTARLTLLSLWQFLNYPLLTGTEWYFNASLFLPFQQLATLDLSFSGLVGCVKNQGFERLSRLERLESLDLSGNYMMNTSILSAIGTISSLRSLNLSGTGLERTADIQGVLRLENLEHLSLDYNNFNNTIFSFLSGLSSLRSLSLVHNGLTGTIDSKELSKLWKLEVLDLSYNSLNNSILQSVAGLSSLKTLYLSGCDLKGIIDIQELSKRGKLEVLDLSYNNLKNSILQSVAGLSSLKILDLSGCDLKGIIDLQDIGVSTNLSALYLGIGYDYGRGNIQLRSLGAYPYLKTISLIGYNFEGPIFIQGEGKLSNVEELFLDYSSLNEVSFQNIGALSNSLKRLSLRNVNGTVPAQGFPNLKKLEYPEMSNSALNNSILKYIGKMSSLKSLTMSGCGLSGSASTIQGLCKLKHLEELSINDNEFSGSLPQCIANLTSLARFDLSENHFTGSMSPLRSLTSLQSLEFSSNLFQVPFSLEPFFNHSNLKYLYGQDNLNIYDEDVDDIDSAPRFQLEELILPGHGNVGGFPKFLSHQHNLQDLDLSHIQLKGEKFPYWLLSNNTKLSTLLLANTSLSGPFHLPTTHKYLHRLDISKNSFNSTIPIAIGRILPNLYLLNLSQNCLVGSIPSSFGKICRLRSLDLSSNELSGRIPEDLGIGCPLLSEMVLSYNDFEGPILPGNADWKQLNRLQVDNNNFSGNIPYNLLNSTRLIMLDASNNHLSGCIPGWIVNMSSLEVLDLSVNRFSENLPTQVGPPLVIREVYLSENKLQGSLGTAFYNCSQLMTLDLSHNYLIGKVPQWIGKLHKLSYLLISHNKLEGEIPIEVCSLDQLSLVDLSNNNLSGYVPSCVRLGSQYMKIGEAFLHPNLTSDLSYMKQPLEFTTKSLTSQFQGSILAYFSGIDLSCNNLSDTISVEFGNLSMIQVLNLSHNSLTGPIPESFSNLMQIESLDLSYNNLDGNIPSQIIRLHFISHFSVAHNNLSGRTPEMVEQFGTFDNTSYEGNPFLCGPPLLLSCSTTGMPNSTNTVEEEDDDDGFMDMQVFYMSCVVSYIVVLLSIGAVLYINPYWRRRWFYMIEVSITNCYYFVEDNFVFPLFKLRASQALFI